MCPGVDWQTRPRREYSFKFGIKTSQSFRFFCYQFWYFVNLCESGLLAETEKHALDKTKRSSNDEAGRSKWGSFELLPQVHRQLDQHSSSKEILEFGSLLIYQPHIQLCRPTWRVPKEYRNNSAVWFIPLWGVELGRKGRMPLPQQKRIPLPHQRLPHR